MRFKVRKIRREGNKSRFWDRFQNPKKAKIILLIVALAALFFAGTTLIDSGVFREKARQIFSLSPLKTDQGGHTNLLLLGIGGPTAEGGNLSDSIMIVSINPELPSVALLGFPRDLFISSKMGDLKVNEIYARARYKHGDRKGLMIVEDAISRFAGIEIHYTAVIDFDVFANGIDLLGGLDIFVPQDIVDPFYPDENYGYQTFVVRKGLQHFDGATALKYARSRKTSSDYDRARRQQDLALAIHRRIEAEGWAANVSKIREFYDLFRRKVNTDLGLTEIAALAKIGMGIDYGDIVSSVLNDDPTQKGGLLFTPAKEFYGGQFVLLPKDLRDTQSFMELILIRPDILLESAQIAVLNGSGIEGKAAKIAARLRRLGFHVIDVANFESDPGSGSGTGRPVPRTFIRVLTPQNGAKNLETADFLKDLLKAERIIKVDSSATNPDSLIDIEIVLGTN